METEEEIDERITPDQRWMQMLQEYLPKGKLSLPQNPRVLNIGCGNNVTWNYLGVALFLARQGLGTPHYVGVDSKEKAFAKAREKLGGLVEFVVGDARHLTQYLSGLYHLAIFEHPNLSTSREGPRIWGKIFGETGKLLDRKGGVVLTSFWLNDHIPAQVTLERAGYHIAHSGTNRYPGRVFDTCSKGESLRFDKYITIARAPSAPQLGEDQMIRDIVAGLGTLIVLFALGFYFPGGIF